MYRAYGLVTPTAAVTGEQLATRLRAEFPGYGVALNGQQITVSKGDWEFELLESDGPDVLAESKDIAEKMAGQQEDSDVASCSRRFEIWSDTPDPEFEHFEKYQLIVGVLKSIPGIIVVDPTEPSFL